MEIDKYMMRLSRMSEHDLDCELETAIRKAELIRIVKSLRQAEKRERGRKYGEDERRIENEGDGEKGVSLEEGEWIADSAKISSNDLKYGLIRFSSRSRLAAALRKGNKIDIEYKGNSFECNVNRLRKIHR